MDKQPTERYNASIEGNRNGEGETLNIGLTLEQASSLILILTFYGEEANKRVKAVRELIERYTKEKNTEWVNKLTEGLRVDELVLDDAENLYREVKQIMIELEKPKPLIIRPDWKG